MDEKEKSPDSEVNEDLPNYNKRYTYSDYIKWDDGNRWELIDGVPFRMAAPNRQHQKLLGNLQGLFWSYLKDKPCEVYPAPFDVRLNADTLDDTVVQPDIVVVCDHDKLNDAGCAGAPDLVIEILSPSTSKYDKTTKFNTYLKHCIREYWILDPETKTLAINLLNDNKYITHIYHEKEKAPVHILESFNIDLSEVFEV